MYHDIYLHTRDYRWAASLTLTASWLSLRLGVGIVFTKATVFGGHEYGALIYVNVGPFCLSLCVHYSPDNRVPDVLTPEMLDDLIATF